MSVFGKAVSLFIPRKTQNPVQQPDYGTDMRAIETWAKNVIVQLTAGSGITLTPSGGVGPVVEIAASGGGFVPYASLTGPGETVTPGALTQTGNFTVDGNSTVNGDFGVSDSPSVFTVTSASGISGTVTGASTSAAAVVNTTTSEISCAGGGFTTSVICETNGTNVYVFVASANSFLGFFGLSPGAQRRTVTGLLSTVTDPAAKAVLTSIIAALATASGYGLIIDGTT